MRLLRGPLRRRSNSLSAALADHLGEPSVTRLTFTLGRQGVREKVAYLRSLVDEDRNDPYVRSLVASILRAAGVRPSDPVGRAKAIFDWVQREFVYVHEPVETFTRPRRLLLDPRFHFGDCDDFTLALCTLLEAAGFDTLIEAIGWGGRFRHVFLRVKAGANWYAVEGTLPMPFGFDPTARAAARHGAGEFRPLPGAAATQNPLAGLLGCYGAPCRSCR